MKNQYLEQIVAERTKEVEEQNKIIASRPLLAILAGLPLTLKSLQKGAQHWQSHHPSRKIRNNTKTNGWLMGPEVLGSLGLERIIEGPLSVP